MCMVSTGAYPVLSCSNGPKRFDGNQKFARSYSDSVIQRGRSVEKVRGDFASIMSNGILRMRSRV